jgi:hypothetical protein
MRGQHDDLANSLCGLIHILTPVEQAALDLGGTGTTWGVITAPRFIPGVPGMTNAEDLAYAAASGRRGGQWRHALVTLNISPSRKAQFERFLRMQRKQNRYLAACRNGRRERERVAVI